MKRLVICCDGTWNRPDSPHITNIEKIARTVQTDPSLTGQTPQLVYYLSGVGGAGYETDRILGGAFGLGLFHTMIAGYRFLAQNYEPGDEVFVLGFSRGAFTARSLVGMVGGVGLLTKAALVDEQLVNASDLYRQRRAGQAPPAAVVAFREAHCHPDTPVAFLGVFDTVGALGVPGARMLAPKFHDLRLGDHVRCARQALAIDELRLKFEPAFWEVRGPGEPTEDPRVRQVWFEGAHSDVGGGYAATGLSDTTLLWMVTAAHSQGLVFDTTLLEHYVASGSKAVRHNPLRPLFRVDNRLVAAKQRARISNGDAFEDGLRRLDGPGRLSVRIANTAAADLEAGGGYRPANLARFAAITGGFAGIVEPVVRLPDEAVTLAELGEPL